jgi:hypothetical protein
MTIEEVEERTETALMTARDVVDRVLPFRMDATMDDRTALRKTALEITFIELVNSPAVKG